MSEMTFDEYLAQTLEAIDAGKIAAEDALGAVPDHWKEELELCLHGLGLMTSLRSAATTPDPGFRKSALEAALASLQMGAETEAGAEAGAADDTAEIPVVDSARTEQIPLPPMAPPVDLGKARAKKRGLGGKGTAIAAAAALMVLLGGTAYAASGSLPGSPLYPVKIAAEKAKIAVSINRESRALALLDTAENRLREIKELMDGGTARTAGASGLARTALAADRAALVSLPSHDPSEPEVEASFARQRALLSQIEEALDRGVIEDLIDVIGDPGGMSDGGSGRNRGRGSGEDDRNTPKTTVTTIGSDEPKGKDGGKVPGDDGEPDDEPGTEPSDGQTDDDSGSNDDGGSGGTGNGGGGDDGDDGGSGGGGGGGGDDNGDVGNGGGGGGGGEDGDGGGGSGDNSDGGGDNGDDGGGNDGGNSDGGDEDDSGGSEEDSGEDSSDDGSDEGDSADDSGEDSADETDVPQDSTSGDNKLDESK